MSPKATHVLGVLVHPVLNPKSHSCFHRWASGALYTRFGGWSDPEEDTCIVNEGAGSRNLERFPVGLKLAVFGIFIIVIFVYITVEKKPLLWLSTLGAEL